MSPTNLALRLLLELAALGGVATLVWRMSAGPMRFLLVAAAVIALGAIWATFAVPNDPSRSGNAPVPVPGSVRLILELAILFGGAWAFYAAGFTSVGLGLAALIVIHYLLSLERIGWLLQQ